MIRKIQASEVCPIGDINDIKVFRRNRKCSICGSVLSIYNPNDYCLSFCKITRNAVIVKNEEQDIYYKTKTKNLLKKTRYTRKHNKYPGTQQCPSGKYKVATTRNHVVLYMTFFDKQEDAYKALKDWDNYKIKPKGKKFKMFYQDSSS